MWKDTVSWITFARVMSLIFVLLAFWLMATDTNGADVCRAPGFVVTDGVVMRQGHYLLTSEGLVVRPDSFSIGGLTVSAPHNSNAATVLNSLVRDGRRFQIIAVPK